ncbi:MAG: N-acetylglucosamine-6-phosphate deacetylase [Calditrichia bacterium]
MAETLLLTNCSLYNKPGQRADILMKDGIISEIGETVSIEVPVERLDAGGRMVIPGLIDIHIQGAGGADILDGTPEALQTISKTLASLGVTGFLATTVVHSQKPNEHLRLAAEMSEKDLGGARLLGVHLEGPFINPAKRGGISPDSIYLPSKEALDNILEITGSSLKMMTIAPEMPGNDEIIRQLLDNNIVPSFGHSNAGYEETARSLRQGIPHVTHIFNAMRPLHHRNPGPLPAVFEDSNVTVQIISDGVHLHPGIIRMLYRIIGPERCVCITDGVQAIGLPEGRYIYNTKEYESRGGAARYPDGTLIGTAIGLNEIAWRFMEFTGCSPEEAVNAASLNPARVLGLDAQKGSIAAGKDADLVLLNADRGIAATIVAGRVVFRA